MEKYQMRYKPRSGKRLYDYLMKRYRYRPAMVGDPRGLPQDRKRYTTLLYKQAMDQKLGVHPILLRRQEGLWYWF